MKSAPYTLIVLLLAILTDAIPTTSNRIPLRRRSRRATDSASIRPATETRFLGAQRVANLIKHANEKYANTLAAYERNTGSRHPLDTWSRTSTSHSRRASDQTVSLDHDGVELWYGALTVGTPSQDFTVDFDTGSSDLMLPHELCADCQGHRKYDSFQSTTSQDTNEPILEAYGSGEFIGMQYVDRVDVGAYEIATQGFGGVYFESPDFFPSNFVPDGLCGLAFQEISGLGAPTLMQNLNKSGLLPSPVFAFELSVEGESTLTIGGVDDAAFNRSTLVSVPVKEVGYWQVKLDRMASPRHQVPQSINADAIIDTGTTLILGPNATVSNYFSDIPGARCSMLGPCTVPCATINETTPTLTFGGRDFKVSPESWDLGPVEDNSPDCIAGLGIFEMEFMIVGDVFLRNVYSVFDFGYPPNVQFAERV